MNVSSRTVRIILSGFMLSSYGIVRIVRTTSTWKDLTLLNPWSLQLLLLLLLLMR